MATYTLAGLQTANDAYETAIKARDWSGAVDAAATFYAVRRGIAANASADGGSVSLAPMPNPNLYKEIELAKAVANSASTTAQRRIHARTNFFPQGR